jgi:hypothetical protein
LVPDEPVESVVPVCVWSGIVIFRLSNDPPPDDPCGRFASEVLTDMMPLALLGPKSPELPSTAEPLAEPAEPVVKV